MRSGLELLQQPVDLEARDHQLRQVGHHLVDALRSLPIPDDVPWIDKAAVQDMRWTVAEALRLTREHRRQIADRLASATPGQSQHASFHDPPNACQDRGSPP